MISRSAGALALALVAVAGISYVKHVNASRRAAESAAALSASMARGDPVLRVPHAPGPITLDGDTDDPGWRLLPGPARTYAFRLKDGRRALPYSEARLLWSGDYLYLALYASDQDIQSHTDQPDEPIPPGDDSFRVVFSRGDVEYAIDVTPKALITDGARKGDGAWDLGWNSGAHASREIDGLINDTKSKDEEWAIELAVPLASIGLRGERGENIGLSIGRCDIPFGAPRVCSGWGEGPGDHARGRIVLE
jgi:hypothetical protein